MGQVPNWRLWLNACLAASFLWFARPAHAERCDVADYAAAAQANAASIDTLPHAPFGTAETGWRIYAPLVGAAALTSCEPTSPGFARALAGLQRSLGLKPADGRFTPATWAAVYRRMQAARPVTRVIAAGCPPPPDASLLTQLKSAESYGKPAFILSGAAAALRKLREAALDEPQFARQKTLFTVFSGYRDPAYDAARCAAQGNCDGRRRAVCSPHRTGTAVDLYLGIDPPDSTAYPARRAIALSPAYAWLVCNAPRFGFANYAFEPWHWEWTGNPSR